MGMDGLLGLVMEMEVFPLYTSSLKTLARPLLRDLYLPDREMDTVRRLPPCRCEAASLSMSSATTQSGSADPGLVGDALGLSKRRTGRGFDSVGERAGVDVVGSTEWLRSGIFLSLRSCLSPNRVRKFILIIYNTCTLQVKKWYKGKINYQACIFAAIMIFYLKYNYK